MELRFKIKEIPADGAPFHVRRAISSELLGLVLEGTDGDLGKAAVELDANLMREHDDVIVTGRLRGSFVVPCGRCVEPAKVPIDVRIDGLFQREGTAQDPKDAESLLDSPDVFEHDGISILLDEAVRELLIAELPIAPVCKWSCKGLCPTCGANLNSESCGHSQDDPLPEQPKALAGLANIKLQS